VQIGHVGACKKETPPPASPAKKRTKGAWLTQLSGATAPGRAFPGECCFRVIYFNPNIFFECTCGMAPGALAETSWLMRAVKNAWAKIAHPRFASVRGISRPGRAAMRNWRV
jgi:hypothetical protein